MRPQYRTDADASHDSGVTKTVGEKEKKMAKSPFIIDKLTLLGTCVRKFGPTLHSMIINKTCLMEKKIMPVYLIWLAVIETIDQTGGK